MNKETNQDLNALDLQELKVIEQQITDDNKHHQRVMATNNLMMKQIVLEIRQNGGKTIAEELTAEIIANQNKAKSDKQEATNKENNK